MLRPHEYIQITPFECHDPRNGLMSKKPEQDYFNRNPDYMQKSNPFQIGLTREFATP